MDSIQRGRHAKLWRTWIAFLTWICMGLFSEISGPTLPFLKKRVNANYEEISRALMARSVGFLVGSLLGGVLYNRWQHKSDLWLALACVCGGAGTLIAPFVAHLPLLGTMFCIDGLGKGIMASGANHLLLILWDQKAAVPNQALHFSFGVGAFIAPQLAMPFLPSLEVQGGTVSLTGDLNATASGNVALPSTPVTTSNLSAVLDDSVQWPYVIIGIFTLAVAIVNVVIYWKLPNDDLLPQKAPAKLRDCCACSLNCPKLNLTRKSTPSLLLMATLLMYWTLPVGAERAYGKFLFAFSTDSDLQFSNKMASILVLVFWACFTLGRLLATGLAFFLSTTSLMILELSVNTTSAILLYVFAHKSSVMLWTCTAFFAASLSPLFPGALAWANCHMSLTSLKTAVAFISASAGAFIFSWLSGYLFEYHGPRSLMSFMLGYSILGLTLFATLILLSHFNKVSPSDQEEEVEKQKQKAEEVELDPAANHN